MAARQLFQGKTGLWEVCVGLEVHAQISSASKLFSNAPHKPEGGLDLQLNGPNARVSHFDAALPGTLPVLNRRCAEQAARLGLVLGGRVQRRSLFERKHYFYPDLPHGYQITQQRAPVVEGGVLSVELPTAAADSGKKKDKKKDKKKKKKKKEGGEQQGEAGQQAAGAAAAAEAAFVDASVRVTRIQLEVDSGKSTHGYVPGKTLVDLNRAGSPLLEVVFEPDIRSAAAAGATLRQLQLLLRAVGVSDANMELGEMRADVNISVRPADDEAAPLGERVEVKNMNSVRHMMRAIEHEAQRQVDLLEAAAAGDGAAAAELLDGRIESETRGFDAVRGVTVPQRRKGGAKDYRFLPEPDLPPLLLFGAFDAAGAALPADSAAEAEQRWFEEQLEALRATLPELPDAQRDRLVRPVALGGCGIPLADATKLVGAGSGAVRFFEAVARGAAASAPPAGAEDASQQFARDPQLVSGWMVNELFAHLKVLHVACEEPEGGGGGAAPEPPTWGSARFGQLLDLVVDGSISARTAKDVLEIMCLGGGGADGALEALARGDSVGDGRTALQIVDDNGWRQLTDDSGGGGELTALCAAVVADPAHANQLAQLRGGKSQLFGFFVGRVMGASGGRAHPELANALLRKLLADNDAAADSE